MGCKGSKQQTTASTGPAGVIEPTKPSKTDAVGTPLDLGAEEALTLLREVARQVVAGVVSRTQTVTLGRPVLPSDGPSSGPKASIEDGEGAEPARGAMPPLSACDVGEESNKLIEAPSAAALPEDVPLPKEIQETAIEPVSIRPTSWFLCCSFEKNATTA